MKTATLISLMFLLIGTSLMAQRGEGSSRVDFLKMANYLTAGSSKWMTPNPNYQADNPRSSRGFGLWFSLDLRQNLLRLRHVSYRGDTALVTGESFWLWHPGEQRIKYYSIDPWGGFTEGETHFSGEDKFTTTQYAYRPNGKIQIVKDDNFMISNQEHKAISYNFENNEWKQTGDYPFKKVGENEYYRVVVDFKPRPRSR